MDTVTELDRFSRAIKLKAFQPFESAEDALSSINAVSEHSWTDGLHAFLEMNLPKIKKKEEGKPPSFALGVIDPALAAAIADGLPGLSCRSDETVREVLRGCRLHMTHFVKGLGSGSQEQAQLGLGHSYSRGKVKGYNWEDCFVFYAPLPDEKLPALKSAAYEFSQRACGLLRETTMNDVNHDIVSDIDNMMGFITESLRGLLEIQVELEDPEDKFDPFILGIRHDIED